MGELSQASPFQQASRSCKESQNQFQREEKETKFSMA